MPKAAPKSSVQRSDREVLEAALADVHDRLAALDRQRSEVVATLAADPTAGAKRIKSIDAERDGLRSQIGALNEAIERVAQAERAARVADRDARSAKARVAVLALSDTIETQLAPAVDAAFQQLLVALATLQKVAAHRATLAQVALSEMHAEDHHRYYDKLSLVAPRAGCASADVSVAVVNMCRTLTEVLPSVHTASNVAINGFAPRLPGTLTAAVRGDNQTLRTWFADTEARRAA